MLYRVVFLLSLAQTFSAAAFPCPSFSTFTCVVVGTIFASSTMQTRDILAVICICINNIDQHLKLIELI